MHTQEHFMQRCFELARLGAGQVSPNPMVGCVIVHNGEIIAEGYHQKYGEAHAEVNAINSLLNNRINAAELLRESTVYVSLEPCAHFGKTPPCADLLIKHQVQKVVVGCTDSFGLVNGKGVDKLRAAGIEVEVGVLEQEARNLNKRFFTRIQQQRPYIILKWAQTADGYFSPESGQHWITSAAAKKLVHQWRSEEDAVLVGKRTALIDNPQLNVREVEGRNPLRIVIDRKLELPETLHVFDGQQRTLVINELRTDVVGQTTYVQLDDFEHYLPQLIAYQLYLMDIQSLIIEGGAQILNLFISHNFWDEARVFTGPQTWGEGIPAPLLPTPPSQEFTVANDKLSYFYKT